MEQGLEEDTTVDSEAGEVGIELTVAKVDYRAPPRGLGMQALDPGPALQDAREQPQTGEHRLTGELERDARAHGARLPHPLEQGDGVAGPSQEQCRGCAGGPRPHYSHTQRHRDSIADVDCEVIGRRWRGARGVIVVDTPNVASIRFRTSESRVGMEGTA
jgi:hypothetical protein